MAGARELGLAIGRALVVRQKPSEIVIPAPVVQVAKSEVKVDTKPIADMLGGIKQPAPVSVNMDDGAKVIAEAIAGIQPADLSAVEAAISTIAKAVASVEFSPVDLSAVTSAIESNTAAIKAQTSAIEAQTIALKKEKSVIYDDQGRVSRVKVV